MGSTRGHRKTLRPAHCSTSGEAAPSAKTLRQAPPEGGLTLVCQQSALSAFGPAYRGPSSRALSWQQASQPPTAQPTPPSVWRFVYPAHPPPQCLVQNCSETPTRSYFIGAPTASVGRPQAHCSTRLPGHTWPPRAQLARMTGPVLQQPGVGLPPSLGISAAAAGQPQSLPSVRKFSLVTAVFCSCFCHKQQHCHHCSSAEQSLAFTRLGTLLVQKTAAHVRAAIRGTP